MTNTRKPKILWYDVETTPLLAYVWRLGEQVVGHHQLAKQWSQYHIICVSYAWDDGKPAKTIHWGYTQQDSARVIREFDKIVKQADVAIGKNSDRFDVRHINAQRFIHNLPPLPEWANFTDDVEKQLRKHFIFPSMSLDYISKELGLGGKVKMQFSDWIDIVEIQNEKSFQKMLAYNRKDVEDTRAIWLKIQPHVTPKLNQATFYGDFRCTNCGSQDLVKDGVRYKGKTVYQTFRCKTHNGYAGRVVINPTEQTKRMG